jgi:hypothetical protein
MERLIKRISKDIEIVFDDGKFEDWMHLSDHAPMTIVLSDNSND